jgi:hypothetical protein
VHVIELVSGKFEFASKVLCFCLYLIGDLHFCPVGFIDQTKKLLLHLLMAGEKWQGSFSQKHENRRYEVLMVVM